MFNSELSQSNNFVRALRVPSLRPFSSSLEFRVQPRILLADKIRVRIDVRALTHSHPHYSLPSTVTRRATDTDGACMSNKPAFIPSRDLRNLRTLDLTSSECLAGVRDNLDSLAHLLGASGGQIVHAKPQIKSDRIEVYAPSEPAVEHPPKEIDSFETSYVTRWLSRLISEFTLTCPDDESTALQAERLSERCAALLALAAGRMAAGASVQDHIFQLDDDDNTNLVVKVRDAALVHDSLGTHTWGAAPILSQLLLPLQAIADDAFNVLELGAGTGLVGLTLASWSRRYRTTHETQIVCTDYHPTVLENLAHNIMLNGWNPDAQPAQGAKLSVTARCLDWQSVHRMQQGYGQDVTRELTSQTLPNLSSTSSDSSWSKLLDVDVHSNTFDMLVAAGTSSQSASSVP